MALNPKEIGYFRGRWLEQNRGQIGGSRNVFVKLQGIKNELVYPTFGGVIRNPFRVPAKMFAGEVTVSNAIDAEPAVQAVSVDYQGNIK